MCYSCGFWICVCFFLYINNSTFLSMECMNSNPNGSLCVYPFIPNTRPDGLCDPHSISGQTFFILGRRLICRCFQIFFCQLWWTMGLNPPTLRRMCVSMKQPNKWFLCWDLKVLYWMMKERNEVVSISRGNSILVNWKGTWVHPAGKSRSKSNEKRWKYRYLYTDIHDNLFTKFLCLLYECSKRQTATNTTLRPLELILLDQATVDKMKVLENKWARDIDF